MPQLDPSNKLLDFRRRIFENLTNLANKGYLDSRILGLLVVVGSHFPDITQTEIAEVTDWSAGMISETLTKMLREGLIEQVKQPGSRKKRYKFATDLLTTYETNFKRILSQFRAASVLPSEIESEYKKLKDKFPHSPSLVFFGKYLELFQLANRQILHHISAFSLNNEKTLPTADIKNKLTQLWVKFKTLLHDSKDLLRRIQKEYPHENRELLTQLEGLMRQYLSFFRRLMQQSERDIDAGLILNTFFISYYPLTQDRLIELTGIPRSTISIVLSNFYTQKQVAELTIPEDKHKYYHITFPREVFLLAKQMKTLQISLQMEECVSQIRAEFSRSFRGDRTASEAAFANYLEITETAYRRLNSQMVEIIEILATELSINL